MPRRVKHRTVPTTARQSSWARWAAVRVGLAYVMFVLLFSCPNTPNHPVCRISSFTQSTVGDLVQSTETGARAHAAYNAHLVPFYEKHAQPLVAGTKTLVCSSAARLTKPACDAAHRTLGPHLERVHGAYERHAKPVVEAAGGCAAAAGERAVEYLQRFVLPFFRSAVNDYAAPFCAHHVAPRWNNQVRPALAHYSQVAMAHLRSSVLPAVCDGAQTAFGKTCAVLADHVVPRVKSVTVRVYVFGRSRLAPPVCQFYQTHLKAHVDRVVPWESLEPVGRGLRFASGFAAAFFEEFYFMCYTIVTGEEHPSVLARSPVVEKPQEAGGFASKPLEGSSEHIQSAARRLSGSARQWIQVARGWMGSAAEVAKENLAEYGSRASANARDFWGQPAVGSETPVSTEAMTSELAETVRTVSAVADDAHLPMASDSTTEPSVAGRVKEVVEPAAESVASVWNEATGAVESIIESVVEPAVEHVESVVESVAESIAESVAEEAAKPIVDPVESVAEVAEEAVSIASSGADEPEIVEEKPVVIFEEPETKPAQGPKEEAGQGTETAAQTPGAVHETADSLDAASEIAPAADSVSEAPAVEPITSALVPAPEEEIEDGTSIPVPEPIVSQPEDVSIVAEEAVSAIYQAHEAGAAVVIADQAKELADLIKSASEGVENLENFPSVVGDSVLEKTAVPETTATPDEASGTEKPTPAAAAAAKSASQSEKLVELLIDKVKEKAADPTASVEYVEEVVEEVVVEPVSAEKKVAEKVPDQVVVEPVGVAEDIEEVVREAIVEPAAQEREIPIDAPEEKQAEEDLTQGAEPLDMGTDSVEDVRKSASNWVKDARKSISRELAEERTRTAVTADVTTTLSPEEPQEPAPAGDAEKPPVKVAVPEQAPAEREVPMDQTKPVTVSAPEPAAMPPTKATRAAKPNPSQSDKAPAAAPVPPEPPVAEPKPQKGPRKVKKAKKRVVKKTP
ncbi:hypothetical protein GGF46_004782 [Coemansia sp. RSA 552]|nr:hypothetical protein GGF46_004782 [Coemansia sp. RSA 552]